MCKTQQWDRQKGPRPEYRVSVESRGCTSGTWAPTLGSPRSAASRSPCLEPRLDSSVGILYHRGPMFSLGVTQHISSDQIPPFALSQSAPRHLGIHVEVSGPP